MEHGLHGKLFLLVYFDDTRTARTRFIVWDREDDLALWFKNPLRLKEDGTFKLERVPRIDISRMEEKEFSDLENFIKSKNLDLDSQKIKKLMEADSHG